MSNKRIFNYKNNWMERHSVDCYFCGILFDERDAMPADQFNDNDGGDICPACREIKKSNIVVCV
jgi:hypothetical protein